MVLHMLRRLRRRRGVLRGLRRFYAEWRFRKAGTDDFRAAMESGDAAAIWTRSSKRWIYGIAIPRSRFSYAHHDREHRSSRSSTAAR